MFRRAGESNLTLIDNLDDEEEAEPLAKVLAEQLQQIKEGRRYLSVRPRTAGGNTLAIKGLSDLNDPLTCTCKACLSQSRLVHQAVLCPE